MDRRRYASRRSSRSIAITPSLANASRMLSDRLSPTQSRFAVLETLKKGRIRKVSADETALENSSKQTSAGKRLIFPSLTEPGNWTAGQIDPAAGRGKAETTATVRLSSFFYLLTCH